MINCEFPDLIYKTFEMLVCKFGITGLWDIPAKDKRTCWCLVAQWQLFQNAARNMSSSDVYINRKIACFPLEFHRSLNTFPQNDSLFTNKCNVFEKKKDYGEKSPNFHVFEHIFCFFFSKMRSLYYETPQNSKW